MAPYVPRDLSNTLCVQHPHTTYGLALYSRSIVSTQVLTLTCLHSNWSCYAFDFSTNTISIMDPAVRHPVTKAKVEEHTATMGKLIGSVIYCMRRATGNNMMGHGKWTPKMLMAGKRKPPSVNSGILALNCMRWYNGNSVCDPPRDSQSTQTRKDLTFQLLTMRSNRAKPAISELVEHASRSEPKRRSGAEQDTSQAASSGADNEDSTHSSNPIA
ncbi:hypothetical protein EJB05_31326 [Eragrostis curvula]|uniref:Uncharacterized protein n=1 Tax=Eragrostis curvula TaxID=38414 RepID=A0A5J9UDV7_9POAL|nr:hypothetical protein EJB05_31326 [Eragrostis curvula]